MTDMLGRVEAVSRSATHTFSKPVVDEICLVEGQGVEGDAHSGATVKHRSMVRKDPTEPNLRQVHLIDAELHDTLRGQGFAVGPGLMGENITTRGIDLLHLPRGAKLRLGAGAVVEITGLRVPCAQLNGVQAGLMAAVIDRDEQGNEKYKSGVMGIVITGGEVRPGDEIRVDLPPEPREPLPTV